MARLYVRIVSLWEAGFRTLSSVSARTGLITQIRSREEGQTTAEYALVILAAAAVALVLIGWAQSSGKLPAFFDQVIDKLTGNL
jgi:Flp pilus assembly pilin Flp